MATTKKSTTTSEVKSDVVVKNIETKVFQPEDLVMCRSVVSGILYIKGERSNLMYNWADCGDTTGIEYRDLIYMVRTHGNVSIYEPRIIVEDEDFLEQNPKLREYYESLYTVEDFRNILDMPNKDMVDTIKTLPAGIKNAIRGIAATMIDEGELDALSKIKALDELFGTNMLLSVTNK